ncbi:DUF3857 domain-containing protein [Flagellimonas sp. S3867]|uniref:DUF3857 domain-containing protein n=1 Tax=Flagellimonas sp. S3867 TaxID=2768063 RepID=UPI001686C03C|nr:DUF3857 domain-containing protein [Flagellimonas sp. S3867]
MRILTFPLFVLISFFSFSQDSNITTDSIPQHLISGANAIVRDHQMDVELVSRREMLVNYKRTVTVLNEKGNQHVQAFVHYNNAITIKGIYAEVYDKKGESIKKIRKKDFLDVSAVDGGTLYSDSRVLYMGYLPVDYPYTVKFSYQMKTDNTGTIPSWYFLSGFLVSTEYSKYTVKFSDQNLKPSILEKNFGDYNITPQKSDNQISYEARDIEPLKDENLRPPLHKIFPRLMVSPVNFYYEGYNGHITNWKEAGHWMNNNLLKDQDELTPSTISIAKKLVEEIEDPLEKAKKIYQYVQENTRYISVQVGIGGLRPISAIEVDRVKYGDCKGLANYTKALLKAIDIESYYVHVEAGQDKVDFEDNMASFGQGNHVILAIPHNNQYYWIDCTSQVHPFGFLGDFTDDRKVLLMKPDGGEIANTDAYVNEDNHQLTKAKYILNEKGGITGDITIWTKGIQYDQHFALEGIPDLEVDKYYKNYWSNINNLKIEEFSTKNNKNDVVFEENIKITATKYGIPSDDRLILVLNAFNNSQYVPARSRNRRFPLEISRGYLDEDEYELQLPESYSLESLPQNVNLETKFGEYQMEFEKEANKIRVKRRLFIKEGTYPSSDYKLYRSFKRSIVKFDNSKAVLIQKI